MNELIHIAQKQIGQDAVQTVNARDLHQFLEIGKDFSTWIKARIEQYDFAENSDFLSWDAAPQNGGAGNRGIKVEYALTIDMAKELAMVERNEKGKQARQYFIACERRLKEDIIVPRDIHTALSDPAILRQHLLTFSEEIIKARQIIEEQQPKVDVYDRISETSNTHAISDACKLLQQTQRKFFAWLVEIKWIYHRPGKSGYLAYADKIQAGYLIHKTTMVMNSNTGEEVAREQVRITGKGLIALGQKLADKEKLH